MTTFAPPDRPRYEGWIGRRAVDVDGAPIGEIAQLYYDDRTRRPEWLAVRVGDADGETTLVPLVGASCTDDEDVQVPLSRDVVADAPGVDTDEDTNHLQEQALWSHYGYDYAGTSEADGFGYGTAYTRPRADADFASGWDEAWMPRRERLRRFDARG